jgi:hypothetical protein
MTVLFGGPLAPLGWSVGFLRVPFVEARRATIEWRESLAERFGHRLLVRECGELNDGVSAFLEVMRLLDPLQTPPKKELLVGTDTGWTMNVVNNHLGGDSVSWTGHLSDQLQCEAVLATHVPEDQYPYPSTQFELLGPKGPPPLHYVRTISAGKFDSGRWEFSAIGEPQPFEEVERYAAKRIRDRLTREMLIRYLAALEIEPDRADFFNRAVLLETDAPFASRTSTLGDTQREYGISPLCDGSGAPARRT